MGNRLCSALLKNNNPKSPIAYFKLVTVREHEGWNGNPYIDEVKDIDDFHLYSNIEPYYHIYGKRYIDDKRSGTIFLGAFDNIDKAKDFLYNITGEIPVITYT